MALLNLLQAVGGCSQLFDIGQEGHINWEKLPIALQSAKKKLKMDIRDVNDEKVLKSAQAILRTHWFISAKQAENGRKKDRKLKKRKKNDNGAEPVCMNAIVFEDIGPWVNLNIPSSWEQRKRYRSFYADLCRGTEKHRSSE